MAIEFKKTDAAAGRSPELWRGECKVLPGGFEPVQDFAVGTLIKRGTPVYVNMEDKTAWVFANSSVLGGDKGSGLHVRKNAGFNVGDTVLTGKYSGEITAIDTSAEDYDVLTTTLEHYSFALYVIEDEEILPNAVLAADLVIEETGITVIDVAYEAVVLMPSLDDLPEGWAIDGFTLTNNHAIKFIYQ